jgi:hypothetical protein
MKGLTRGMVDPSMKREEGYFLKEEIKNFVGDILDNGKNLNKESSLSICLCITSSCFPFSVATRNGSLIKIL